MSYTRRLQERGFQVKKYSLFRISNARRVEYHPGEQALLLQTRSSFPPQPLPLHVTLDNQCSGPCLPAGQIPERPTPASDEEGPRRPRERPGGGVLLGDDAHHQGIMRQDRADVFAGTRTVPQPETTGITRNADLPSEIREKVGSADLGRFPLNSAWNSRTARSCIPKGSLACRQRRLWASGYGTMCLG